MKIILTAGGTGGHVYPAIALARYMLEFEQAEILFIGTNHKMEATEVPKAGFLFHGLDAKGFTGSLSNRLDCLKQVMHNIGIVKQWMKEFQPDVVIGFGGYVSVPVMLAAKQLGIKTMIHEQNSVAGLANKTVARFVDGVVVSFAHSLSDFPKKKTRLLGSPRASEVVMSKKDFSILRELQLSASLPIVYIVMGSLGSESVNGHMIDVLKKLNHHGEIQVVYVSGKDHFDQMKEAVGSLKPHIKLLPFVDQMRLLPHVDVICCRAGATTLAEITALGIPALVIPSPYVAHNHQMINAAQLEERKAAFVIEEKNLTCDIIVGKLLSLCLDAGMREAMAIQSRALSFPDANKDIVAFLKELVSR